MNLLSKETLIVEAQRRFEELGIMPVKIRLGTDIVRECAVLYVQDHERVAWADLCTNMDLSIPLGDFVKRYLEPAIQVCKQHLEERDG